MIGVDEPGFFEIYENPRESDSESMENSLSATALAT